MDIHQMQVRYLPAEDRLLWQLRTFAGEVYTVWLTRRMLKMLGAPLRHLIQQSGLQQMLPHATAVPEAREMLAEQLRERDLPGADFATPFNTEASARPLGEQPMLPQQCDLGPGPQGQGLNLRLSEPSGRSLSLQLSDPLAAALQRLIEQALQAADWDLATPPVFGHAPEAPPPRSAMN